MYPLLPIAPDFSEVTKDQFVETVKQRGEKRTHDEFDPEAMIKDNFESIGAPPPKSGPARRQNDDLFGGDGARDEDEDGTAFSTPSYNARHRLFSIDSRLRTLSRLYSITCISDFIDFLEEP